MGMENMSFQDMAAMRSLEQDGKRGWSGATAIWVLVGIIVLAIFVGWATKNNSEKTLVAVGMAQLQGKISCMEPKVMELSAQNYGTAQTLAGTVSALNKTSQYVDYNLRELNERFLFNEHHGGCGERRGGCCGGGGNRRFDQRSTYIPQSTEVIVSETCQN